MSEQDEEKARQSRRVDRHILEDDFRLAVQVGLGLVWLSMLVFILVMPAPKLEFRILKALAAAVYVVFGIAAVIYWRIDAIDREERLEREEKMRGWRR